ncbi:BTB/POZ domain-containing protein [Labilibaculum euxinus]|uniref:HEAT repeat domain-containing protein n=1 Tax=Labilibaculum euxinus TaxID=2686357 RepID=A0A7M4D6G7_9BACT|nr:hypothetical protein [Labilibaculum euxinus]MUP38246.1 hypothetical protein [Labilibaculum euxinus]MVB07451.1 hypothetical protein [Labilibaculum euxinus]
MSNISKKDLHNSIILGLSSLDNKVVLDSINQLREEGKPEDITPLLDLMISNSNKEIQSAIHNFLADLKNQDSDKIIIEAIADEKYLTIRKILISICWETSIDFSKYISTFVDLLIVSDFETSFEAFTVIENLTEKISEEIKPVEMAKLKDAISGASPEKKGILHEAIHIIDQL